MQRPSVRSEQERAGARIEGRKVKQEELVEHGKMGYMKGPKEEGRANESNKEAGWKENGYQGRV